MTYLINVLNPQAVKIGELKGVTKAEIYEVINNQYVADVSLSANTYPSFLHFPNMLEIDNDYFIIADIDKQRSNSKSISLSLEHVSYILNNPMYAPFVPEDEDEYYEGDIYQIINQLWGGIGQFNIIVEGIGGYYNYVPSASGGRSRIQEFARQYGFEVVYNKFDITVRPMRGNNKGLVLEVGKNIRSISQKISRNDEFYIEYAHEVDIVDFSEMSGEQYKNIVSADLGDTVRMIDKDLAIDATERIVAKRYDPLFKQIPQLDVGQVVRDIINVLNKDEDEKKEEEDHTLVTLFKVGDVNALPLMSDERSAVLDYITDTTLQGIIPSADIEVTASKKGVSAALKSGVGRHLTAMITTETEDGIMASFTPVPSTDLTNLVLPGNNVSVSVVMIITTVPFADLATGLVPVEGDPEDEEFVSPLIGAYGVRVLINDNADGFLDNFKVGDVDVLSLDKTDATDVVIDYIKGDKAQPIAPTVYEVTEGKLKGIYATLKANYKNHHLTFLYSTKDEEGDWGVEVRKMPFTNARIFATPRAKDDSVIMVITKEPYESITRFNVDSSFIKAFGVRIQKGIEPIESMFDEFKVGGVDMLAIGTEDVTQQAIDHIKNPTRTILSSATYNTKTLLKGISVKLKDAYASYNVYLFVTAMVNGNTMTIVTPYNADMFKNMEIPITTVDENGNADKQLFSTHVGLIVTELPFEQFTDDTLVQAIGVHIQMDEPSAENWLSEFRIGDVNVLAIPGALMDSDNPNAIVAEIGYTSNTQYTGLFLNLKEKYANADIIATMRDENGTHPADWDNLKNFAADIPFPNGALSIVISVINSNGSQHYGVKFVKHSGGDDVKLGVQYGYVDEIIHNFGGLDYVMLRIIEVEKFREQFLDWNLPNGYDSEPTGPYIVPYGSAYYKEWNLVQVIDGVVSAILSNNDQM